MRLKFSLEEDGKGIISAQQLNKLQAQTTCPQPRPTKLKKYFKTARTLNIYPWSRPGHRQDHPVTQYIS
jgi:hypothetical protein